MSDLLTSTLAGQVRQERLRLGWTQANVAVHAGISFSAYRRFELSAAITLPRLVRVLDTFGLTVSLTA